MNKLELQGLDLAPAQAFGSIRLVPLIRRRVREDLRLARRACQDRMTVVSLEGGLMDPGVKYVSFVPHGLVASWSSDGSAVKSETGLAAARAAKQDGKGLGRGVRALHRMAKREGEGALRFLPLHLAMEGFLATCFGGPEVALPEWSRRALSRGLDPRCEIAYAGAALPGFAEALRVFEIHEGQCGVLVFVADALASAFVVPHPEDYRALHRSLLEDFYGELLYHHGFLHPEVAFAEAIIDGSRVSSLEDLRAALSGVRRAWADFGALLAAGALGRELRSEDVYRLGAFRLQRFTTDMSLHQENHIGEAIVRDDGTTEYLKTFRLSDAQARRAHLLLSLRANGWSLERTAAALSTTPRDLVSRLDRAGFGHLISPAARHAICTA